MEELSNTVNKEPETNMFGGQPETRLSQNLKREKSQWSVYQLYLVCAEKITSLQMRQNQDIGNI